MSKRTYYKSAQFITDKESQGYDKFINQLEKKIEERSSSPGSQFNFPITERSRIEKLYYAEELKKQMEYKDKVRELEKVERKKPPISEDFHGYPNLPQTPDHIRRLREIAKMKKQCEDLTVQLAAKKNQTDIYKTMELESARQSNVEDIFRCNQERQIKMQKKEQEKQLLVAAWNQAQKAKELQTILEISDRKGVLPRTVKSDEKETIETKHREDESSQINFEIEFPQQPQEFTKSPQMIDKKRFLKEKVMKLKEYMDCKNKGSYQHKIKQLVSDAKKQREERRIYAKKSISPSTKLLSDMSSKHNFTSHRELKFR